MAVTDAYALLADYKDRVPKTGTAQDALITEMLKSVSRLIDRETERFFTVDAADVVRVYDANGGTRLYVDDLSASPTTVRVDLNADYDYADSNETLTEGTHFWPGPFNADKGPEPAPFRFLEIVPNNSVLSTWPDQLRAVEVTGKFGWPAVPGAIKEATILIVRELLDLHTSGMTMVLQDIDTAVNLSPKAFSIVQRIKREYGRISLFV